MKKKSIPDNVVAFDPESDLRYITREQAAYMLSISDAQVTRLRNRAQDPLPTAIETPGRNTRNYWDLRQVMQWRIDEVLGDASPGTEAFDLTRERAKLARQQTEGAMLKNQIARGEHVPMAILEKALSKVIGSVVAAFDSIPGILKKRCKTSTKELVQICTVLDRVRNDLAGIQLDDG